MVSIVFAMIFRGQKIYLNVLKKKLLGNLSIAKLAQEFGGDPTGHFWIIAPFGPISRERMLNIAAISGQVESVKWVLEQKANINEVSPDGLQTALHAAAFSGQEDVLKTLLKAGAARHQIDAHGFTAARLVESAMFIKAHLLSKKPERWRNIQKMLENGGEGVNEGGNEEGVNGGEDGEVADGAVEGGEVAPVPVGAVAGAALGALAGGN
jgi:hypothetical protein